MDTHNLKAILNKKIEIKKKILSLNNLEKKYPLDIRLLKEKNQLQQNAFFMSHQILSFQLASLQNQIDSSQKKGNISKTIELNKKIISLLPNKNFFIPVIKKHQKKLLLLKNINIHKHSYYKPINTIKKLVEKKKMIHAINYAKSHLESYLLDDDFVQLYENTINIMSTKDFYMNGFLTRYKNNKTKRKTKILEFETDQNYTISFQDIYYFNGNNFIEKIFIQDSQSKESIKTYSYAQIKNSSILLKENINSPSIVIHSSELQNFIKYTDIILSNSFYHFFSNNIINIIKVRELIKKHNPNNLIYLNFIISFYYNTFFINIIILLFFLFISSNIKGSFYKPSIYIFGVIFSFLIYTLKMYFTLALLYISNNDFIYFYLFDNFVNLLLFSFAITLYSINNPKTKTEETYAFYQNKIKR